jgi:metallo-beta-lactamase family protein
MTIESCTRNSSIERTAADWNACDWPFDPKEIRFVILTHAHVDHCGLIPMLYKRGFRGLVYCSKETAENAGILLRDAAELSDIGFTAGDVDAIRWHEPLKGPLFGRFHPIDRDLFVRFFRSGHVVELCRPPFTGGLPDRTSAALHFQATWDQTTRTAKVCRSCGIG